MLKHIKSRIVNVHIPKTAGSSFRTQMAWHTDVIGVEHDGSPGPFYDVLIKVARRKITQLAPEGLHFMSGHFRFRDIKPLLNEFAHEVSLVTFVRDPIRRAISDYYYSTSKIHTDHVRFRAQFPNFEDYLQAEGYIRKQFDCLKPHPKAGVDETFDTLCETFDFIGLTEKFDDHIVAFLGALGLSAQKKIHSNTGTQPDKMNAAYLQFHDQIAETLHDEIDLFQRLSDQWDKA